MIKLNGQLRVTGESGRHYFFNLHFFHPAHKPHIEDKQGIYIYSSKRRIVESMIRYMLLKLLI